MGSIGCARLADVGEGELLYGFYSEVRTSRSQPSENHRTGDIGRPTNSKANIVNFLPLPCQERSRSLH